MAAHKDADAAFLRSAGASFTWYPWHLIPRGLFTLLAILFLAGVSLVDRGRGAGRLVVGGLAFLGVALMQAAGFSPVVEIETALFIFGVGILCPALVFLTWRLFSVRNFVVSMLLVPVVTTLLLIVVLIPVLYAYVGVQTLFVVIFLPIPGLLLAAPLAVLRAMAYSRVTFPRMALGFVIDALPALAVGALVVGAAMGSDDWDAAIGVGSMVVGYVIMVALFAGLFLWNDWARAVAMGTLYARRHVPRELPGGASPLPTMGD